MRDVFVKTQNAMRFLAGIDRLSRRGAAEACIMVVDGAPGLGKSEVVEWAACQNGWVSVRLNEGATPQWLLRDLLGRLRVSPAHGYERMQRQAKDALAMRAAEAARNDETFAIVMDEADHIAASGKTLEAMRDLSDFLEIPFILVGMGRLREALVRFPQVASRIGVFVEFKPAGIEDVSALVKGLCEVPVAPDLIAFLHTASCGLVREIKEGIKNIESFGLRNSGKEIGCKEMQGKALLNDRKTGSPIMVRVS